MLGLLLGRMGTHFVDVPLCPLPKRLKAQLEPCEWETCFYSATLTSNPNKGKPWGASHELASVWNTPLGVLPQTLSTNKVLIVSPSTGRTTTSVEPAQARTGFFFVKWASSRQCQGPHGAQSDRIRTGFGASSQGSSLCSRVPQCCASFRLDYVKCFDLITQWY